MGGRSLTRKLIEGHLASGKAVAGDEIGLSIDQVRVDQLPCESLSCHYLLSTGTNGFLPGPL